MVDHNYLLLGNNLKRSTPIANSKERRLVINFIASNKVKKFTDYAF